MYWDWHWTSQVVCPSSTAILFAVHFWASSFRMNWRKTEAEEWSPLYSNRGKHGVTWLSNVSACRVLFRQRALCMPGWGFRTAAWPLGYCTPTAGQLIFIPGLTPDKTRQTDWLTERELRQPSVPSVSPSPRGLPSDCQPRLSSFHFPCLPNSAVHLLVCRWAGSPLDWGPSLLSDDPHRQGFSRTAVAILTCWRVL